MHCLVPTKRAKSHRAPFAVSYCTRRVPDSGRRVPNSVYCGVTDAGWRVIHRLWRARLHYSTRGYLGALKWREGRSGKGEGEGRYGGVPAEKGREVFHHLLITFRMLQNLGS